MGPWLNKLLFILFLLPLVLQAQDEKSNEKDYKDKDQHERFLRRRKAVANWQINELRKNGALVVRLRSNQLAINGLLKAGKKDEAIYLAAQTYAINKNTMMAYIENFKFCPVYFMFGHSSDTLLNGARRGFFLDTNLAVNTAIELKERFYLLAERDYSYNSSVGFVPESEAKLITEKGTAVKQMAIILKNKYGHQLKNPMPHEVRENSNIAEYAEPCVFSILPSGEFKITYYVNRRSADGLEKEKQIRSRKHKTNGEITITKNFTYFKLAQAVSQLDYELKTFYQRTPAIEMDKMSEDVKPFLY